MDNTKKTTRKMEKRLGVIGLVVNPSVRNTSAIREVLRTHSSMIIGNMEIHRADNGNTVMALIIEATTDEVGALTGKLGTLPDVRIASRLV